MRFQLLQVWRELEVPACFLREKPSRQNAQIIANSQQSSGSFRAGIRPHLWMEYRFHCLKKWKHQSNTASAQESPTVEGGFFCNVRCLHKLENIIQRIAAIND